MSAAEDTVDQQAEKIALLSAQATAAERRCFELEKQLEQERRIKSRSTAAMDAEATERDVAIAHEVCSWGSSEAQARVVAAYRVELQREQAEEMVDAHRQCADLNAECSRRGEEIARADAELAAVRKELAERNARVLELEGIINSPQITDFLEGVRAEAAHQQLRWGSEHDAGKADSDWFWLIGYLAGKALRPEAARDNKLHHIITTAAVCLNWHAHATGARTSMRPGIEPPKEAL